MWDWRWYIRVAEGLRPPGCDKDIDSARARSTISRAYYAIYHVTRHYMAEAGYRIDAPSNAHTKFWEAIEQHPDVTSAEREVGMQGKRLMSMRIYADYENADVDAGWTEQHKEAKLKKQCLRLSRDSEAAILIAHKICVLLKRPWRAGKAAPPQLLAQQAAPEPSKTDDE